jgi:hypothetical protein
VSRFCGGDNAEAIITTGAADVHTLDRLVAALAVLPLGWKAGVTLTGYERDCLPVGG